MSIELCRTLASIGIEAYQSSVKRYDEQVSSSRELHHHLICFDRALYHQLNEVEQHRVLSQEALERQEVSFLKTYWEFHSSLVQTHELMNFLRMRTLQLEGLILRTSELTGSIQRIVILRNEVLRGSEDQTQADTDYSEIMTTLIEIEKMAREFFDRIQRCHRDVESIYQRNLQPMNHIGFKMMKLTYLVKNRGGDFSKLMKTCDLSHGPIVRQLTDEEKKPTPMETVFGDHQTYLGMHTGSDSSLMRSDRRPRFHLRSKKTKIT